jgi:hypothetical protein
MYCKDEGLGIVPLAVAGAATGVVKGISSAISSIFGGGPSKEQKPGGTEYEYRKATAQGADIMARDGNVNAWHFLGGLGRAKGLPFAFQLPGLPKRPSKTSTGPAGASYSDNVLPVNWMADKWGSSFQPIQVWAAQDYRDLGTSMYPTPTTPTQPGGVIPVQQAGVLSGSTMPLLLGGLALALIASRRR